MVQTDIKKLVAYSSVAHLGFVMLGIFALNVEGLEGSVLQMVNHGLSTGALFLLVGMLYERRHTRQIADFGGIARPMPVFAAFFVIVAMSSVGLPALNGFVGEFLILIGRVPGEPGLRGACRPSAWCWPRPTCSGRPVACCSARSRTPRTAR